MRSHQVSVRANTTAPPEAVWSLLADVTTWPSWSGFTDADYEAPGDPPPHGVGAVRRLRAGRLRSRETVLAFEPPTRLSYDYAGPLPLESYRADVTLEPIDTGTRITWTASFTARRPVPGVVVRALVHKVLRDISGRLAAAARSGPAQPSADRSVP